LEQLGLNLGYILVQIISFLILFVVVRAWIARPLMTLLERRREKLAQGLEDARVAAEARSTAERDAARITSDAQARAARTISEATERAEKAMLELKAQTEQEIVREREAALAGIEEERNRILGDLRGQVAALAISATQKLIGEALDEKRQRALIDEFFSGVKSGKIVILEGAKLAGPEASHRSGEAAEVVSALPLTKSEQQVVKTQVLSKLGKTGQVSFRVDPAILGGLVVHMGDKVLDGSVAGKLEGLRQTLR
jgi:F-type H+-transporting ATPase subunit b